MSIKNQTEEIAAMLIEAMEKETAPWMNPWKPSPHCLRNGVTGHEYRGINLLILSFGLFEDPRYCTFFQAQKKGWKIKKGSKSLPVRFAAKISKDDKPEESEEKKKEKTFFVNKWFRVFNFEQIEGAPPLESPNDEETFDPAPRCEEILKNIDVASKEVEDSDEAFYSRSEDCVTVPERRRFKDATGFYRIVFHEIGHATGAAHRLNRRQVGEFASPEYAFEELVAEITSFLVGCTVGCGSNPSANTAAYLKNWIGALQKDGNYIFKACRLADRAMRWILYPEERAKLQSGRGKEAEGE
jgi:antirestriction protein ArdC